MEINKSHQLNDITFGHSRSHSLHSIPLTKPQHNLCPIHLKELQFICCHQNCQQRAMFCREDACFSQHHHNDMLSYMILPKLKNKITQRQVDKDRKRAALDKKLEDIGACIVSALQSKISSFFMQCKLSKGASPEFIDSFKIQDFRRGEVQLMKVWLKSSASFSHLHHLFDSLQSHLNNNLSKLLQSKSFTYLFQNRVSPQRKPAQDTFNDSQKGSQKGSVKGSQKSHKSSWTTDAQRKQRKRSKARNKLESPLQIKVQAVESACLKQNCLPQKTINHKLILQNFNFRKFIEEALSASLISFELIYSASENKYFKFWQTCSALQSTLIVLWDQNHNILGGYAHPPWPAYDSPSGFIKDQKLLSFIFDYTKRTVLRVNKQYSQIALAHRQGFGPCFGDCLQVKQGKNECVIFDGWTYQDSLDEGRKKSKRRILVLQQYLVFKITTK